MIAESRGQDLVTKGGMVPEGTKLRAIYKGNEYQAEVRDGAVLWSDDRYTSLSAAAAAVAQSTGIDREVNGWRFWEYLDEEQGEWKRCTELRD